MPWLPTLAAAVLPFASTGLALLGSCGAYYICSNSGLDVLVSPLPIWSVVPPVTYAVILFGGFFGLVVLSLLAGQCGALASLTAIWATLARTASEEESTVPLSMLWEDGSLVGKALRRSGYPRARRRRRS